MTMLLLYGFHIPIFDIEFIQEVVPDFFDL